MSPFYIFFIKRAAATALIFSSLLCWQPTYAAIPQYEISPVWLAEDSVRSRAISSLLARAADETYSVPGNDANAYVPAGKTYSNIVVATPGDHSDGISDIQFGTGTVTLTGQNGQPLFNVTTMNQNSRSNEVTVKPNGDGDAILVLEKGSAIGNISLMPNTYGGSWHGATLLIGSGGANVNASASRPTVSLTGNIASRSVSLTGNVPTQGYTEGRFATVHTQGADFVVTGGIGYKGPITNLIAENGDITLKQPDSGVLYDPSSAIMAFLVSAKNGSSITADSTGAQSQVYYLDLAEGSTLALKGENSQLLVHQPIGAKDPVTGLGQMAKDSHLESREQLSLLGGVIQGAGDIEATESTITANLNVSTFEQEQPAITQGGKDPLKLTAQDSIAVGEVETDSLHSKTGDIIVASVKSSNSGISGIQQGQIYVNPYRANGYYFPRYKIRANKIIADNLDGDSSSQTEEKGRVIAGEINMPLTNGSTPGTYAQESAELKAAHLYVSKMDARDSNTGETLPASTGNVSIKTGSLTLTSADPLRYHRVGPNSTSETVIRDYASEIGGNMTLDDVTSNFTSLEVIGASTLNGGKIGTIDKNTGKVTGGGAILKTGSATFDNVSFINITDTLDVTKDLSAIGNSNSQDITEDFIATRNGESHVKSTIVGGKASITDGSYEGSTFDGHGDAVFSNVHTLTMDQSLTAQNITITGNETANVASTDAKGAFSASGGSWKGDSLTSGGESSFTNLNNLIITDANVGTSLGMTDSSATADASLAMTDSTGSFTSLTAGTSVTVTGGAITATNLQTGDPVKKAGGDVTVSEANFSFGVGAAEQSQIHGKLTGTSLGNGAFGDLKIDDGLDVSGGTLSGQKLDAASATLKNNSLNVADSLTLHGDFTATDNVASNIATADIDGDAQVSGGSLKADNFSAASSTFENVEALTINNELTAKSGSISMSGSGERLVTQATSQTGMQVTGGSYEGGGISSKGDATFENTTSVNVDGATAIDGKLSGSGNKNLTFSQLKTGAGVEISGGAFNATHIETGLKGHGDVSLTKSTFQLATDGSLSQINGSLSSSGDISGNIGKLTISDALSVTGGFVEGATLTAGSSVLKNNALIHVDDLTLTSNDLALDIEDGSILTVGAIHGVGDSDALVQGGKLVIVGDLENQEWSGEADWNINLEAGDLEADVRYVCLRTGDITGTGKDAAADDIRAHQLDAGNIEVTDANLFLTGLGEYASTVRNNLVITQNGDTRLGDMNVGGNVSISGGSVRARQLMTDGDASFGEGTLVLAGSGMRVDPDNHEVTLGKATSIGKNLALANSTSQLGDIRVGGSLTSTRGTVTANTLWAGGDVTMNGSDLDLNGLKGSPSYIQGDLALNDNKSANLWHIDIDGGISGNGGSVSAHVITVGKDVELHDAELSLRTLEGQQSVIKGKLTLENNQGAKLGAIKVQGDIAIEGSTVSATGLHADSDALFKGVELSLNGDADDPDTIAGSLTLASNKSASLEVIEIGKNLTVDGGNVESTGLNLGGDASLDGVQIKLGGASENPDKIGGNLSLTGGSDATFGVIEIVGNASSENGSINATSLKAGSLNFADSQSDLKTADITGNAEISGGSLNSTSLKSGGLSLRNGLKAALDEVMLANATGEMSVGHARDSVAQTEANVGVLDLNGGNLTVGDTPVGPVALAVRDFSQGADGRRDINGNVGIGMNGRLILGSRDTSWLPGNLVNQRAIFALANPARLAAGSGIHVSGVDSPAPLANQIRFDPASLLVINGSDARTYYTGEYIKSAQLSAANGAAGALSANGAATANVGAGAQIYIRNPIPNTVIVALGENIQTIYADQNPRQRAGEGDPWKDANLQYDNADKVKIERLEGDYAGQFSVMPISTDDDDGNGGNDNNGGDGGDNGNDYDNGNQGNVPPPLNNDDGAGFLSHVTKHDDPQEADRLVNGAARLPIAGAVPQLAHAANSAATTAMDARAGLAALILPVEDLHARSYALWAVPLYKSSTSWNLTAGNYDYDYHGGIGGIAIGGDITLEDILRIGLSFNIGGGYSKSGGDLADTTNNMNFWGLGAYGIWSFAPNWAISGNVAYTSSYNKVKQDISALYGWNELKSDLQAHVISAGLKLEYRLETDLLDIYPHAGARYHYLEVNDYSISHQGNDIIKGDSFSQNIWTFPLGLKFTKDFTFENGWRVKPMLDLRLTPAAGDIEVKTNSRFTGTATELSLHTQTMDYMSYGGSLGLEASIKDFTLGIDYSVEVGAKSVSNAIFGTLRYEF